MKPTLLMTRWFAACVTLGALYAVGCADETPAPEAARPDVTGASGAEPLAAGHSDCEQAGGVCRKSACRSNEVRSDLECGTERGCCLPAP